MIKKPGGFLILLLSVFCPGFTTTVYRTDTPIAYKRYIEVSTILNEGEDVPVPFYFTMVLDLRLSPEGLRSLMGGVTYSLKEADQAHEEACAWAISQFAHLRITIPDSTDGLVLRFLEPTIRHTGPKIMNFSHSDPSSSREDPMQRQLILAAPPLLLSHSPPKREDPPRHKRSKTEEVIE